MGNTSTVSGPGRRQTPALSGVVSDSEAQRYADGVDRLVSQMKLMVSARTKSNVDAFFDRTAHRNDLRALAQELEDLSNRLDELTSVTSDLEDVHDRVEEVPRGEPQSWFARWERRPVSSSTYKGVLLNMRELAGSARTAASEVPDSRRRLEIPFAAKVFLHLRYANGFPRPSLYEKSADVAELQAIFKRAGIVQSGVAVRKVLGAALDTFDRSLIDDELETFLPYIA